MRERTARHARIPAEHQRDVLLDRIRKKGIQYEQLERINGKSKWGFWSLINLALDGLTAYTTSPLRIASVLGILCSIIGFIYLVYILVKTLLFGDPVAGYPTIMVTIAFHRGRAATLSGHHG